MGSLLAADLSLKEGVSVSLLASRCAEFSGRLEVEDWDSGKSYQSNIFEVTDDPEEAVKDAKLILVTVPANAVKAALEKIYDHVSEGTVVGFVPGSGGVEFYTQPLLKKGCTIFGMQRVHAIVRISEYAKTVSCQGRKQSINIAVLPRKEAESVSQFIENLLDVDVFTLDNYMSVTFSPSNQILHTARLYSLFHDYTPRTKYSKVPFFYKDWDILSSDVLLNCDNELQDIMSKAGVLGVASLLDHYESKNSLELQKKISSITAFSNILSPMVFKNDGYIPDFDNRYFTADFPYGLCLIKGFAVALGVSTPVIDKLIRWYEGVMGVEFFVGDEFVGRDVKNTSSPQNFGINTMTDIINYYSR